MILTASADAIGRKDRDCVSFRAISALRPRGRHQSYDLIRVADKSLMGTSDVTSGKTERQATRFGLEMHCTISAFALWEGRTERLFGRHQRACVLERDYAGPFSQIFPRPPRYD